MLIQNNALVLLIYLEMIINLLYCLESSQSIQMAILILLGLNKQMFKLVSMETIIRSLLLIIQVSQLVKKTNIVLMFNNGLSNQISQPQFKQKRPHKSSSTLVKKNKNNQQNEKKEKKESSKSNPFIDSVTNQTHNNCGCPYHTLAYQNQRRRTSEQMHSMHMSMQQPSSMFNPFYPSFRPSFMENNQNPTQMHGIPMMPIMPKMPTMNMMNHLNPMNTTSYDFPYRVMLPPFNPMNILSNHQQQSNLLNSVPELNQNQTNRRGRYHFENNTSSINGRYHFGNQQAQINPNSSRRSRRRFPIQEINLSSDSSESPRFGPQSRRNQNRNRQSTFRFNPDSTLYVSSKDEPIPGLTQKQISLFPRSKYQGKQNSCTICLDVIKEGSQVTFLFCFHVFHSKCGLKWLSKSAICPLCNMDMRPHLQKK